MPFLSSCLNIKELIKLMIIPAGNTGAPKVKIICFMCVKLVFSGHMESLISMVFKSSADANLTDFHWAVQCLLLWADFIPDCGHLAQ